MTCTSGAANGCSSDAVPQWVCEDVATAGHVAPAASGLMCYDTVQACEQDVTNPCHLSSQPCSYDLSLCGSGFSLEYGFSFGCTASTPAEAFPQGNEYLCYTTQAACEGDAPSGCSASGTRCVDCLACLLRRWLGCQVWSAVDVPAVCADQLRHHARGRRPLLQLGCVLRPERQQRVQRDAAVSPRPGQLHGRRLPRLLVRT
jgi:hypothetical protein